MNELFGPMLVCLIIFLTCLLISKHFKDPISTTIFLFFGIAGMLLIAKVLYNDSIMPQEWWKVIILPGILIILIILSALESYSIIEYVPETEQNVFLKK